MVFARRTCGTGPPLAHSVVLLSSWLQRYGGYPQSHCIVTHFVVTQILLEQRYGSAVDWWAFGVLMYEMLLGQSPFRGDDEDEIFDAILEDEPLYPITMPRDAVSVLQKVRAYLSFDLGCCLTCLWVASHTRSCSPSWFWQRRCGGDQKTSILQGREL